MRVCTICRLKTNQPQCPKCRRVTTDQSTHTAETTAHYDYSAPVTYHDAPAPPPPGTPDTGAGDYGGGSSGGDFGGSDGGCGGGDGGGGGD